MRGIVAPRSFQPGDVVHVEKPFVELPCIKFKDVACASCFKSFNDLKSCVQCLTVKYCGKTCQKEDWKNHRFECKLLKNLPPDGSINIDIVRLIGNVILKIKGKDWKTIKSSVLGTDVSFDDIDSRLEEISTNPTKYLHYKQVTELVRQFIGDENMPSEDDLMKIFGKVYYNCKPSMTLKYENGSYMFIIGISAIDGECIPNCNIFMQRNVFKLWAMKKINESEKISVVSQNILLSTPDSLINVGESCKCTDCSLPHGESVLSRITDEKRAYSVIASSEKFLEMWCLFPNVRGTPGLENMIDNLLKQQADVLGNTNGLYLKLLAIKCFQLKTQPLQLKEDLKNLETHIVSVFGENFSLLQRVYNNLVDVNFLLGELAESAYYTKKVMKLTTYEEKGI